MCVSWFCDYKNKIRIDFFHPLGKEKDIARVHRAEASFFVLKYDFENYCSCKEKKLPEKYSTFMWHLCLVFIGVNIRKIKLII